MCAEISVATATRCLLATTVPGTACCKKSAKFYPILPTPLGLGRRSKEVGCFTASTQCLGLLSAVPPSEAPQLDIFYWGRQIFSRTRRRRSGNTLMGSRYLYHIDSLD